VKRVRRSALVPFPASAMYDLVNDVPAYPDFLPWCRSSAVNVQRDDFMEARLELVKGAMSRTFTTRNQLDPGRRIEIGLLEGPFSHLHGLWQFDGFDDRGSEVSLRMEFEFRNPVTGVLFGPMFEDIANSQVDAFTRRARDVYGES
jgi:ribosome-associated toxin RatA of RatAB toxin-antitoxin module